MIRAILAAALMAAPALAQAPAAAVATGTREDPPGRYSLPVGVFDGTAVPLRAVQGVRRLAAWRRPLDGQASVAGVFEGLRAEAAAGGGRILFDCATEDCGGFDFRRALELLPPPEMYLDLAEFHAFAVETGSGAETGLRLVLVSRTGSDVVWQESVIRPEPVAPRPVAVPAQVPAEPGAGAPAPVADIAQALDGKGMAVLDGLDFATGSADLPEPVPASVSQLAAWMTAHPRARATVVGHSDASGDAAANQALSRQRAESVRRYLVERLGLAGARLEAAGVGALAPRASNATPEGRRLNRRVEVVIAAE
ncbi:OmpA family protein [Mangrovicoccus algicola]|uniref:OmpA family protein n=1 Tax=Mangrovicoccus algicola TaxID=2771008 RepID=A0A8J7CXJ2_9RHOB|nr:OmpA family protein [Mangrovicoccus algicola]